MKYVVNVYAGVVAERMLRRLRYQLYSTLLRFPLPHLRRVSQGELVQMINAETEALGGFVGEAVSTPGLQAGTLLTSLFFMFVQDWKLGLAAVALYPLQIWLIPKLQRQVNLLGKERVRQVRRNAEKISEVAMGARDIRANDATVYERSRFSEQLGTVFWIRFDIYKKKFLIKFINNFISQLGPFFFYSIGGYLVLQGQMTIGALTAVVGAQKDITSPWRELLTYYQSLYDVKIKYEQVCLQFDAPGLKDEQLQLGEPDEIPRLTGELRATQPVAARRGRRAHPGRPDVLLRAAEPYRDRRPCRQRQGGAHPGPGRFGRAEHRPGDHRRQGPARAARGRARTAHRLCRQPDHDLRRVDRGQPALRPEVPPAAAAPAGRGRAESRWSASCTRRKAPATARTIRRRTGSTTPRPESRSRPTT